MFEQLFPGGMSDLSAMPTDLIGEVSAMASLASLGLDWILADEARFDQFVRETSELYHSDPAQCVTYEAAKHLAEHAEGAANRLAHLANKAAELDQQAAEEHDEQASQARPDHSNN